MDIAVKHPVDRVKLSFVIFDLWALCRCALKITDDGLTRSGTVCFIAVPMWQQWTRTYLTVFWETKIGHSAKDSNYFLKFTVKNHKH